MKQPRRSAFTTPARKSKVHLCLESLEERNLLTGLLATPTAPIPPSEASQAVGVGVATKVSVAFNLPLNPSTIIRLDYQAGSDNFRLCQGDVPDPCSASLVRRVTYNDFNQTATLDTEAPLGYGTAYTAFVIGGENGVRASDGTNYLNYPFEKWTFTTARNPAQGTSDLGTLGIPILLVTPSPVPLCQSPPTDCSFSSYYPEILRAEGLNAFHTKTLDQITGVGDLTPYDVVLLSEFANPMPDQIPYFTDYVLNPLIRGNLIAMRPDPNNEQLRNLFQLGNHQPGATLSNQYVDVLQQGPGFGIVDVMMKYHGTADIYTDSTAEVFAHLCASGSPGETGCPLMDTEGPAVTLREVPGGGKAAAFTYDLARSVVLTRQGDPTVAGEARVPRPVTYEGLTRDLLTSYDLFAPPCPDTHVCQQFLDPEAHWNNLLKIGIPQADEQQRLLANLIGFMNLSKMPLPRFWYLPSYYEGSPTIPIVQKAAIVMTGDDHVDFAGSATVERFGSYLGELPSGGKPIRSSSYVICPGDGTQVCAQNGQPSDQALAEYTALGFEVGLHPARDPNNSNYDDYEEFYTAQFGSWKLQYLSLPTPPSNRTDLVEWYNYDEQPSVELGKRMRLDTNYYYWFDNDPAGPPPSPNPGENPGLFTGSGLPMRFAKADGTLIDVYQATTQMTDGSQQCYSFNPDLNTCARYGSLTLPNTVEHLLTKALGSEGYYGAFTVNAHTDQSAACGVNNDFHSPRCVSEKIIARAQAHEVPVLSSREMLEWLDGRNGSSFRDVHPIDGNIVAFELTAAVGLGRSGLDLLPTVQAMLPTCWNNRQLSETITRNQTSEEPILAIEDIKGVKYSFFWGKQGSYTATYVPGPLCGGGSAPLSGTSSSSATLDPAAALAWIALEGSDAPSDLSSTSPSLTPGVTPAATNLPMFDVLSPAAPASGTSSSSTSSDATASSTPAEASAALLDLLFADLGAALPLG